MKSGAKKTQYTLRGIPPSVDRALRARARREGRSLNDVAVDALRAAVGEGGSLVHDDLDDLAGTWEEDPAFDAAIEDQRRIDETLWS
jgi:plasmid stability protein